MTFKKAVRQIAYAIPYYLYARPRTLRTDEVTIFGFSLIVPPTVFHPELFFSSKFLGAVLEQLPLDGKKVLDIGCGSGILSLIAGRAGASVIGVDLNPVAVRASEENARRNQLHGSVNIRQGDLLTPLKKGETFDLVVMNPPFYAIRPDSDASLAWRAGSGLEFFQRLASQLRPFIADGGKLLYVISSDSPIDLIEQCFVENGFSVLPVKKKSYLLEKLYLLEVRPRS